MARKGKHKLMEDDFSDSGSDSSDGGLDDLSGDERAEALLNNPSARRRQSHKRKRNAKDDATYGVFGDDMNLEEQQQQPGSNKRYHKMPTFVSSSNSKAQDPAAEEQTEIDNLAEAGLGAQAGGSSSKEGALDQNDDDEDEDSDDMETSSDSSGEEDQQSKAAASTDVRPDDPEQPRAGLGAGLGMPTSFGRPQNASTSQSSQPKQSFLPQKPSSFLPKPRANLTNEEKRHFAKLEGAGGIGFKMLSKMGWSTGTGLGAGGEGRVNPVDSQQRPVNMGIGYQGFKEKTKQSVQEARRRGDHVSEDEDEEAKPSKGKGRRRAGDDQQQQGPKEKAWKAPKPKKRQVQHLSYEEILAQQSADQLGGAQVESGVGQIIDMTGAELPSLQTSLLSNLPVPSSETERLQELRYNVKLINDKARAELDSLAKEGNIVQQKQQSISAEQKKAQAMMSLEAKRIATLEHILSLTQNIASLSSTLAKKSASPAEAFEVFSEPFQKCTILEEYKSHRLDEVLVAAIAPIMRMAWRSWDVLDEPRGAGLAQLSQWQRALRVAQESKQTSSADEDFYFPRPDNHERQMTPYESLMWNDWLPRIRSALNNSWDVTDAQPAIAFFTSWSPVLPSFVRDNILDQLILPKVSKGLSNWTPKSKYSLHSVVLPWLEHAGPRMSDLVDEAKRALKAWFRGWRVKEGVLQGLHIWKDIYSREEWNELLLKYILPTLGGHLQHHLNINPREQKMQPLLDAVAWRLYLQSSMLDQLFEAEVIPKWLDTLWVWLTAPQTNFQEISQWYTWWKDWFADQDVGDLTSVKQGLAQGLSMMNQALDLGEDAQYRLAKPSKFSVSTGKSDRSSSSSKKKSSSGNSAPQRPLEVSFRSIVEEEAAAADLLFQPANKSHPTNGLPLFRVSKADKKAGGVLLYIQDDVVWMQDGSLWQPVGIAELIERAQRA